MQWQAARHGYKIFWIENCYIYYSILTCGEKVDDENFEHSQNTTPSNLVKEFRKSNCSQIRTVGGPIYVLTIIVHKIARCPN